MPKQREKRPRAPLTEKQRAALRPPWKKGENPGTRISNYAYKAVTLARRNCPAAIAYAASVVNDPKEPTSLRLKAADLILSHGMPRGDNSKYMGEETVGAITLNLVMPKFQDDGPTIDASALTVYTPTQGSGD